MKKMFHLMLIMIFISSLLMFKPFFVAACSCAGPESVEEALKSNTAIFSGKVLKIDDKKSEEFIQSTADPIRVLFEVKSSWKGIKQNQVIVTSARNSASCGLDFEIGNEYLVYAYGDDKELGTGLCSRTKPLQNAHEDLQILGVGKTPSQNVNIELSENDSAVFWIIGGVFVLILLLLFFLFRIRRKKNK